MKLVEAYALSSDNGSVELIFTNEIDRNEMALALWQESIYERFMYDYNLCGDYFEKPGSYIEEYRENPLVVDPIVAFWSDRLLLCQTAASENIWTYNVKIVEDN